MCVLMGDQIRRLMIFAACHARDFEIDLAFFQACVGFIVLFCVY